MPITFDQDRAAGVRFTTITGTVTDAELLDAYARVLASSEFDPTLDVLVDLSGVDRAEVSAEGLGVIAGFVATAASELRERPRVALVVRPPFLHGMVADYVAAAERHQARIEYRVFADVEAARAWLGLPP